MQQHFLWDQSSIIRTSFRHGWGLAGMFLQQRENQDLKRTKSAPFLHMEPDYSRVLSGSASICHSGRLYDRAASERSALWCVKAPLWSGKALDHEPASDPVLEPVRFLRPGVSRCWAAGVIFSQHTCGFCRGDHRRSVHCEPVFVNGGLVQLGTLRARVNRRVWPEAAGRLWKTHLTRRFLSSPRSPLHSSVGRAPPSFLVTLRFKSAFRFDGFNLLGFSWRRFLGHEAHSHLKLWANSLLKILLINIKAEERLSQSCSFDYNRTPYYLFQYFRQFCTCSNDLFRSNAPQMETFVTIGYSFSESLMD